MVRLDQPTPAAGWCSLCEKVSHLTRPDARQFSRRNYHGGRRKQQYRCPHNSRLWHNGELPPPVKQGEITRDQIGKRRYA